jgi:hypothetical protein
MRRTNLFIALMALAASLFLSGTALAHGAKPHAHLAHHGATASEAGGTSGPALAAVQSAGDVASLAAHAHGQSGSECPATETDCCSTHCCAPAGLRVEPCNALPARITAPSLVASDGPPPDAAAEAQFRPPCR